MPVGDEVEAVVLVLQRRPVVQRAHEMAEVELAGRPHARDDARFHGSRILSRVLVGGMISALATPVSISAYRIRKPYCRSLRVANGQARRQQPEQHVAAVERRHRESG